MRNPRVDGDRLWESLMEMARIGATPKGGVCRLALTDLDRAGPRSLRALGDGAWMHRHGRPDGQHVRPTRGARSLACPQ
jgi:hypothetical protein